MKLYIYIYNELFDLIYYLFLETKPNITCNCDTHVLWVASYENWELVDENT